MSNWGNSSNLSSLLGADLLLPESLANLEAQLLSDLHARGAERARSSFAEFVRQFWNVAGNTEPLVWGKHLDALCLHLQAVEEGLIRRLAINIAPGHGKSKIVSVLYPAWCWARRPSTQFLCVAYASHLAERDSVYCRQLIESPEYTSAFMRDWRLKDDQNAKGFWANTSEGHRIAIGVGGTGQRADRIVIDDPLSAVDAISEAARTRATQWIGQTLTTRFNDAATGACVMIMQRLHEEDPTAFVLAGGGWEHLRLPSEFEPADRCITHATVHVPANGVPAHDTRYELWRDWRSEPGELLFPEKFPQKVLDELKAPNALGAEGFAGQHQQRPMPEGGGMFKVAHWRFWKPDGTAGDEASPRPRGCYVGPARALPKMDKLIVSCDATFKLTQRGSFVAIHVWGAVGGDRFLLDRVHERMDFDDTEKALLSIFKKWPRAREKIIEGKANGSGLLSRLTTVHHIAGLIEGDPGTLSKEQRAQEMLPYHRAGNIYLPEGAPWLEEYIGEHAAFPNGAHDDDVDCQSQAIKHLEVEESFAAKWSRARL